MVRGSLKEHKDTLKSRQRTYSELSRRGRWILSFGIILTIISAFVFPLSSYFPDIIPTYSYFLFFGVGILLAFIGGFLIKSKGVPSIYLSPDESIFLRVFDALTFLETHMKEKLEPARYQCLNELRDAYKLIEYYWVPPEIGVVKKEIGNEIETFREKFDRNLIFTLENGTRIEKVYATLTEFGKYLIDPSKQKLVALNEKMDSLLQSKEARPRYPVMDFFKRHQIHKHTIIIGSIFAIGVIPAFIIYHLEGSIQAAVVAFSTIFGPSIAVYLGYVLRKPLV